jgi:addiction module HigA family antidote
MSYLADDNLPPIHPGELLADELVALGMSARKFARHIGVAPNSVTDLINGDKRISAEMALRLAKAFGTTALYWMNLQSYHDAKIARIRIRDQVAQIAPLIATPAQERELAYA